MSFSKLAKDFNDVFEIRNGIVGVKRDVFFQLIELMYLRKDEIIRNVYFSLVNCLFLFS
jgi:hypothetical protein